MRTTPKRKVMATRATALTFVSAHVVLSGATEGSAVEAQSSPTPRCVTPGPCATQSVLLNGRPINERDVAIFETGMYSQAKPKWTIIDKAPEQMPAGAPYASYQGRAGKGTGDEVIWVAAQPSNESNLSQADQRRNYEQLVAAMAMALMDAGRAGPVLQALYAQTASDRASRLALGQSIARAFSELSEREKANAAQQADWIKAHVLPGMTRQAAYAALRARGLVAYNDRYIEAKSVTETLSKGTVIQRCVNGSQGSSAWPRRNQPMPHSDSACVGQYSAEQLAEPDAYLTLWGASTVMPLCGCHTTVTFTFDNRDKVRNVNIDAPRCPCV